MTKALKPAPADRTTDGRVDRTRLQALSAQMIERDSWSRERLLAYQQERLREVVEHAVANSPYYRQHIGSAGKGDIDLQQLPVLTKDTLMAEFDRIVTDRRLRLIDLEEHLASERAAERLFEEYRVFGTGGTTGRRGVVVYDQFAWDIAVSSLPRITAIQEISPETRVLGIGAPTPFHMTNRLFADLRGERADVPRLAVTTPLPVVVEALNAYQPEAVITYPSFIRQLAAEQAAGRLRIAPQKFCSCAETLTQSVRDLARKTWGATVLNVYAATEANVIGVECLWTCGLHVPEDLVVLEVVGEANQPVPAGTPGRKVLVTALFNRALPFIRYELSDIVTVAEAPCRCGRPYLCLASVQGRTDDVLTLPARSGCVNLDPVILGDRLLRIPAIRQYQLSPRSGGLLVRVVLRDKSSSEEVLNSARQAIATELDHAGAAVKDLMIEAVDEIGRAGTGAKEKLVLG